MESVSNIRHIGLAVLVVASSALLVWFGSGLNPWWPALWFAPLPILLFALRSSWWVTALAATVSWLLGGLNLWNYLCRVLHLPPFVWALIFGPVALVFAAAVLLFRALLRRGAAWCAIVAFPATWVAFEYLSSVASPHGTAGNLSYTQMNFLPFLQLASVTGPWGMSFLLLLFSATLAAAIHLRGTAPKKALPIAVAGLSAIALVLIFGTVRLSFQAPGPKVRVGLIASDGSNADVADEGAASERLFRDYSAAAEELAARGAQVIVMPEKIGVLVDADAKSTDAVFQSLADRTRSKIVVGMIRVGPPVKYNQARVYSPRSESLSYNKQHLLPPFESNLKPGATLLQLPEASGLWGVAICKDMDFKGPSHDYGKTGAGLMLVPAWDFEVDRWWHGHIAVMRGVESGFSIARAAKQGYLTVSDDRGRILAEVRSNSSPFATLITDVPAGHETTFYLRLGDWFAWLALAILAFTFGRLYW